MNTAALASPGHRFWPVGEAAQADYEALRAHVLATGAMPDSLIAARFARRGLPGLIAWPSAEPVFDAALLGAHASAVDPARRSPARRVGRRVRAAARHRPRRGGRSHRHAPRHAS